MLELGCGDGANALAIAQTLPDAHVVGVDMAPAPIERGRKLAKAAGLTNVELRVSDLAELARSEAVGEVDYVIGHGVYSWISPAARGALLECCRRHLAPRGIAFVSYNAYPGSYLRDMARDILAYHLRGVREPGGRLARAHELMETIVAAETPSPYARVLREHLQRMLGAGDALLYHDDLAAISTPFYFHEFIEHATAHGLQFLAEAQLSDSQLRDVPERVGELLANVPDDVVVREQHLDFFTNRMFRQTLLVNAVVPVRREIRDDQVEGLEISSPASWDGERFVAPSGASMATSDRFVTAAMRELCDRWPASLDLSELARRAEDRSGEHRLPDQAVERLRGVLLEAYLVQLVHLFGCPMPACARPGQRPRANGLARAQCAAGSNVLTTLLGDNWRLEGELQRQLLPLLDGRHDRASLAGALGADERAIEEALAALTSHGLLSA